MSDSEKLDLILSEIVGMKSEMQDMKSDIAGMKTEIAGMKSDIAGMKTEIAGIKSDITGMKSEIAGIKSDITGMKSEMQVMKTEIEDLKKEVDEIKQKVTKLDLIIENEIRVNIQRVAEGHLDLSRNLHEAMKPSNEVEVLAIKVKQLEIDVKELKRRIS